MIIAMHQRFQKFTPDFVYQLIHKFLKKITDLLSRLLLTEKYLHFRLGVGVAFISTLYILFYFYVSKATALSRHGVTFFELRYFWIIPCLVPIILVTDYLVLLCRGSTQASILICFVLAFFFIPNMTAYESFGYYPLLIRVSMFFVLSAHMLILITTRSLTISTRLMIFFLLELGLIVYFTKFGQEPFLESFWVVQPYRYVFLFSILSAEATNHVGLGFLNRRFFTYIFNPTNFITPIPIQYRQWNFNGERHRFKSKALLYLVLGLLALLGTAYMQTHKHYMSYVHHGSWIAWIFGGGFNYIYFFLFSYSNITIPTALFWWFGFDVPDAYDLPLLAGSPQDRWRRWNFYFYDWYFRFIFFPVFKITRSQFLAIMTVFGATLFIHLGGYNHELVTAVVSNSLSRAYLKKMAFFMGHGLLVYLGIRLARFFPSAHKLSGWVSVIGMFVIMSYLHYILML
jgi:hypothetical protein